jgi:hypothetical protein
MMKSQKQKIPSRLRELSFWQNRKMKNLTMLGNKKPAEAG